MAMARGAKLQRCAGASRGSFEGRLPREPNPNSSMALLHGSGSSGPYLMVQVPEIDLKTGHEAADYLQNLCNEKAGVGWRFLRVDALAGTVKPGCIAGLFGATPTQLMRHVVTFVRADSTNS